MVDITLLYLIIKEFIANEIILKIRKKCKAFKMQVFKSIHLIRIKFQRIGFPNNRSVFFVRLSGMYIKFRTVSCCFIFVKIL